MGQGGSSNTAAPFTNEQVSLHITNTFAKKCLSPLELLSFKQNFKTLSETQSDLRHVSRSTLVDFLELPEVLNSGPVLYQLCTYLGAFPFPDQAPAILTNEALLRVVVILTGRFAKALRGSKAVWREEIWRGLAVFDRALTSPTAPDKLQSDARKISGSGLEGDEDDIDAADELVVAAFEAMDALAVYQSMDKPGTQNAVIPFDNFLRLLELLLLLAPLEPRQSVATLTAALDEQRLKELRQSAKCMLASFGPETAAGISYKVFDRLTERTMPYVFDCLQILFEKFFFSDSVDLHKRKTSTSSAGGSISSREEIQAEPKLSIEPMFPPSSGSILTMSLISQIATILPGKTIFRRLRPLYNGNEHGFSMGQFEKSCLKWQAPSILLVSGRLVDPNVRSSHARGFLDSLPHQRLKSSARAGAADSRITYGAYLPVPWKQTPKACFGNSHAKLFQLAPVHDVFQASEISTHYAYFNKPPSTYPGLGFGSALPERSSSAHISSHSSSYAGRENVPLGPVSLHIDDALEYSVFTHLSGGGGSFHTSVLPSGARASGPRDTPNEWQDRFEIDALEVWGVGGDQEADAQRAAWDWEEREAEARRRVNLGTGDVEMDKELLRMAGLMGPERTGGSMA